MGEFQTSFACPACCPGGACCGPSSGCCYSETSTVNFSITYSGGSGVDCPAGATKSRTNIPFSAADSNCGPGGTIAVVWEEVVGTETWRVTRANTFPEWVLYWEDSATGCWIQATFSDVAETERIVNCCGLDGELDVNYSDSDFQTADNDVFDALPASATLVVNGNTCCFNGSECIDNLVDDDVNCDGVCDSNEPCTDCNPAGVGTAPNAAIVWGMTGGTGCDTFPNLPYDSYSTTAVSSGNSYCTWLFIGSDANWVGVLAIHFCTEGTVTIGTGECGGGLGGVTISAGEWAISFFIEDNPDPTPYSVWNTEQTTGFACDLVTGKISGSHLFGAGPCDTDGSHCLGTPMILVPA